ncbi:MAG: anthranilate phosphoribosyltransferase [Leptospiraceae bacterium]|nr:anthranilate phosphoribosyltransferase [Leptospiraceae bacterium]
MNIQEILNKLTEGNSLTETEATFYLNEVMQGKVPEIHLAGFLTAMKLKTETTEELTGFVKAVRQSAVKPSLVRDFPFLDTCGTGGDGKNSLNISTLSALTLASMSIKVAKHGNRSVSSLCGSSDLLEALGYSFQVDAKTAEERLHKDGFTFLFAPNWHPAMKHAANVRKTLGMRTIFNLIGPLANPLSPTHQIIGVYHTSLLERVAKVISALGVQRAIVCHSKDGYDEFSLFADTEYILVDGSNLTKKTFSASELKLKFEESSITAESKEAAIELAKEVISGKETGGAHAVALNAGVGLYLLEKVNSIPSGYQEALKQILSGELTLFLKKLTS